MNEATQKVLSFAIASKVKEGLLEVVQDALDAAPGCECGACKQLRVTKQRLRDYDATKVLS